MAWREILNQSINESTDWLLSEETAARLFRLQQVNPPRVGRITVGQRVGETFSDLLRFPVGQEDFSLVFPHSYSQARILGLKAGFVEQILQPWQIIISEYIETLEDSELAYSARLQEFDFVDLQLVSSEPNPHNSRLTDTRFWVPVRARLPYSIGRFHSEDDIVSDPLIVAPITLEGFSVIFTGENTENRQLRVVIFRL